MGEQEPLVSDPAKLRYHQTRGGAGIDVGADRTVVSPLDQGVLHPSFQTDEGVPEAIVQRGHGNGGIGDESFEDHAGFGVLLHRVPTRPDEGPDPFETVHGLGSGVVEDAVPAGTGAPGHLPGEAFFGSEAGGDDAPAVSGGLPDRRDRRGGESAFDEQGGGRGQDVVTRPVGAVLARPRGMRRSGNLSMVTRPRKTLTFDNVSLRVVEVGDHEGRVALVTGGTSGIGAAVALGLGGAGVRVVVSGRRRDAAEEVLAALEATGTPGRFVAADVTVTSEVDALVEAALEITGRLDIAVNSAGVFDRMRATHDYADEDWARLIDTNLTGVFRCLRAQAAVMRHQGGSIVNIASTVAHRGSLRASPGYVAAKHAVIGLTRQAALEYARTGLRVNAVSPGPTLTEMAAPLVAEGPEAVRAALEPLNPMGAFVAPSDVAAAVLYLCSDAAASVNGTEIVLDGGQLARL